ncbi:hypothetical protein SLEP1_g15791 [Rubroshorea leprosula]|uniref:Uncharacterized protein n=1 Tax=Rubroshorea leprosula TaxID=152421 RepID=A0AAV5INL7_9ROSI|nr:hypothetical protein SLEP1_g15791 [Rubroshorea leprosula]
MERARARGARARGARVRGAAARDDSDSRRRQAYRVRQVKDGSDNLVPGKAFFFYNFPETCRAKDTSRKMERKLNDLWIGSYKVRVKVAEDRRRQISRVRRAPRIREPTSSAGALHEKEGQIVENEAVGSCVKGAVGHGMVVNITGQSKEEVIEFAPMKEETKWVEGSMVAKDQMYEVGMIEEEWRSDPDWWLSDGDTRCESETESEYSLMPNGSEDDDLIHTAKSGGNEDIFDEEMLEKEAASNSNRNFVMDGSNNMFSETEDIEDGYNEPNKCNGLVRDKQNKPDESYGPDAKMSPKRARDGNDIRLVAAHEHVLTPVPNLENRGATGKRRKHIVECYPQNLAEIGDKSTQWVTTRGLWYSDECDWVMKESIGASGGLICVWNNVNFVKLWEFARDGFLGIDGVWGSNKVLCHFVNVYAPQDRYKKVRLWEELGNMVMEKGGCWMIAGDFNAGRCPEERRGRTGECLKMEEFNVLIETIELVDIRLANRRFTWYRPDGSSMSRLDRFLMTKEMYSLGCKWVQQGMKRIVSDHYAVILKTSNADWGPKPFRVLNAWQQHPDFKNAVEGKWRKMEVKGYVGYQCK